MQNRNKEKQNTFHNIWDIQPPNNNPTLDQINITNKTIIVDDFNAHFRTTGYNDLNIAGKTIEDFRASNNIELVYKWTDSLTFLYYNGISTNPDLTIVSSDLSDGNIREIGSNHRMIINTIKIQTKPNKANR